MKLRSYPDTAESKHRKIGMYKSPVASSVKKQVTSVRKSSTVKKAPAGNINGMEQ